jgi:PAS domain S-box-containing protein
VSQRTNHPDHGRDRSSSRHDLAIVLGAVVLFAIGVASGAFRSLHGSLDRATGGIADAAVGILVVAGGSGAVIAALQRRRRRADQRDRSASEAKFRAMIEQVPAVAYAWDPAHRPGTAPAAYISPQIERLLGFTAEQWLDEPELWGRQVHPDDLDRVLAAWKEAVEAGQRFIVEYRLRTASGAEVWVRDEAAPVTVDGVTRYRGVMFDVTSEREAQEALRSAQERYRSLVEQLPAVIYIDAVDELATAHYVSPQYERLTGFTPAERLADPGLWMRMIHPDDRDRVMARSNRTNETGEDYDIEHRIIRKDGRVVWVHDHAFLVRSSSGDDAWQGVLSDITDRKVAEETLATRDRILEAAGYAAERFLRAPSWQESIDDVLGRLGRAGSATRAVVFENVDLPAGLHVVLRHAWLADDAPATIDRPPSEPYPYGDEYSRWVDVLRAGDVIDGPVHDLPEGERSVIAQAGIRSTIIVPVHVGVTWWGYIGFDECHEDRIWQPAEIDAIRVVANTLGAAIEREQGARHLTEAEERYRAIVEHVPAAIYLDRADHSMRTIYVSPQIEDITGFTPQEWIDEPDLWLSIMAADDRVGAERTYLESVAAQRPWKAEYRINTRDGRTIWLHDETTFVTDADGHPLFLQGVLMDITERKLAEQTLRASERHERDAAERLRALDEMKNTFLAAVSHELRSPLTSILGLALTLERSPQMLAGDRDDLLERLAFNARKLDRLLKDLLDIDRLNRGIVEPQYRTVDVATLTRRSVESLDALAGREIEYALAPLVLTVDPPKLERIVENLVSNAVRHTPPSCHIWVRLEPVADGALLSVEDDGPGVPQELRDAVFEPFRQGPTASPHSPGTGVGLSLVARFTELHGGRAWVEDRIGGGAAFRVFLPAAPVSGLPGAAPSPEPLGAGAPSEAAEVGLR